MRSIIKYNDVDTCSCIHHLRTTNSYGSPRIMNSLIDSPLTKRFKSFMWRAGAIGAVATLTWIVQNIGLLELSSTLQGFVNVFGGLILGEITKYLNTPEQG